MTKRLVILFASILTTGPTLLSASAVCVDVSANAHANLRAGPGQENRQTWKVYRYMPFEKLDEQNNWYRVKDVDGDEHWIAGNLVTSEFQCAVVSASSVNMRTKPGYANKASGKRHPPVPWNDQTNGQNDKRPGAQRYYAFKLLEKKQVDGENWVFVEDAAGGKAWIHADYVWIP